MRLRTCGNSLRNKSRVRGQRHRKVHFEQLEERFALAFNVVAGLVGDSLTIDGNFLGGRPQRYAVSPKCRLEHLRIQLARVRRFVACHPLLMVVPLRVPWLAMSDRSIA